MSYKTIFLLAATTCFSFTAFSQTSVQSVAMSMEAPATTTVEWASTNHDFGEIPQGSPVSHKFMIENTGDVPLEIVSVKPSCSCTVADYTKEAIAPGESGYIVAQYSAASTGFFNKSVTVKLNTTEGMRILKLKGQVAPSTSVE